MITNEEIEEREIANEKVKETLREFGLMVDDADCKRDSKGEIYCFPGEWGRPEFVVGLYPWNMDEALWDLWKKVDLTNAFRKYTESRICTRIYNNKEHVMLTGNLSGDEDVPEEVQYQKALIKILNTLIADHNLVLRLEGWDQEEKLVKHGCIRVREKIVQDYYGNFTISPRCSSCGEHTGHCRCFDDLEDAEDCLKEKYLCDGCYESDLTENIENGLRLRKRNYQADDFVSWLRSNGIVGRRAPRKAAMNHLDKIGDYILYLSENWDDDGTYCECPINGD